MPYLVPSSNNCQLYPPVYTGLNTIWPNSFILCIYLFLNIIFMSAINNVIIRWFTDFGNNSLCLFILDLFRLVITDLQMPATYTWTQVIKNPANISANPYMTTIFIITGYLSSHHFVWRCGLYRLESAHFLFTFRTRPRYWVLLVSWFRLFPFFHQFALFRVYFAIYLEFVDIIVTYGIHYSQITVHYLYYGIIVLFFDDLREMLFYFRVIKNL